MRRRFGSTDAILLVTVVIWSLNVTVTNPAGSELTRVKANGAGKAEFDEFRYDPGLAARRASSDLSAKLSDEIRKNTLLR